MSRQQNQEQKKSNPNQVGQILESKAGKLYVKFNQDVTFKEGETLFMNDYEEFLQFMVDSGKMTDTEAAERFEKTSFVKYNLSRPKA